MEPVNSRYSLQCCPNLQDNPLPAIPIELVLHSLSYLTAYDLTALGKTCKSFHLLTRDYSLDLFKLSQLMNARCLPLEVRTDQINFFTTRHELHLLNRSGDVYHLKTKKIRHQNQSPENIPFGDLSLSFSQNYLLTARNQNGVVKEIDLLTLAGLALPEKMTRIIHKNYLFIGFKSALIVLNDRLESYSIEGFTFNPRYQLFHTAVDFLGDRLFITYTGKNDEETTYVQEMHSLAEKDLIASRCYPETLFNMKIGHAFITGNYALTIVGVGRAYNRVDVCDLNLRYLHHFDIVLPSEIKSQWTQLRNYFEEKFHPYLNFLAVFFNEDTLLFYDVATGRLINYHFIGSLKPDLPVDRNEKIVRMVGCNDKVVASTENALLLFDIHTGRLIHRFPTKDQAIHFELTLDDGCYRLTYSYSDPSTHQFCIEVFED